MDSTKRFFGRKKIVKSPEPKVVGHARTEFGTRLCQRVVCIKCQKVDHVPVRVNANKDQFCRDCAEKILAAYDQGRQIEAKKVNKSCEQCHRGFLVSEEVASKKDHLLCIDCLRGFDVWRGGKAAASQTKTVRRTILTKAGSRTTFRKNIHDAI